MQAAALPLVSAHMKLTHLAHGLTLILIAITAWLAFQANEESKKANAKMDRLTAQATSMGSFQPDLAASSGSMLPAPVVTPAAQASQTPSSSVSLSSVPAAQPSAPVVPPPVMSQAGGNEPTAASLAKEALPSTTPAAVPAAAPGQLTPLQKRVKESPSLGEVQDFVAEHGFVTFKVVEDSGLKPGMKFDLRRDSAVVGRITIEAIEGTEVIANLDPKSVPAGVAVQKGDDIISVVMVQP